MYAIPSIIIKINQKNQKDISLLHMFQGKSILANEVILGIGE
jgi:hypothetical protein